METNESYNLSLSGVGASVKTAVKNVNTEIHKAEKKVAPKTVAKTAAIQKKVGVIIKKDLAKVKMAAEDAPYILLLPFKGAMSQLLTQNGIAHTESLKDISQKFVGYINKTKIKKSSSTNLLSGSALADESYNVSGADALKSVSTATAQGGGNPVADAKAASDVIKFIMAWFKERKDKEALKKAGLPDNGTTPPVTPAESLAIKKADETTATIMAKAKKKAEMGWFKGFLSSLFGN